VALEAKGTQSGLGSGGQKVRPYSRLCLGGGGRVCSESMGTLPSGIGVSMGGRVPFS
jgi:hypothetical protein